MARSEVPSRSRRQPTRAQADVEFRVGADEFLADMNDGRCCRRDLQVSQKYSRNPFVDENPPVLRIVEELDDVIVSIVGLQQVRLRSAAHFAQVPSCGERHRENEVI